MNKKLSIILEKIAKTCLYVLIFLAPLFFMPFTANQVEINKQAISLFLVFGAFICYLIRCFKERAFIYPKNILSLSVLIVLLAVGFSAIFSGSRLVSVFGDFSQPDTLSSFFVYGAAFFLAAVLFKKEDFPRIGFYFFTSIIILVIFGLLQLFNIFLFPWNFTQSGAFNPVGSIFGWGVFMTLGLAMIVVILINPKYSNILKIILSLAGLLMAGSLLILNYQLIWIGLALTMIFLIILRFQAKADLTLPLIILVISLFFVLNNQTTVRLVSVPTEIRPSLNATIKIDQSVLKGVNFLTGSGPGTFGLYYSRFRPPELNQTIFWPVRFNQGFSFLTTILSTLGILGILSFIFLFIALTLKTIRNWNKNQNIIVLTGVFLLIINWFFYPTSFAQALFIFLGLGLLAGDSNKSISTNYEYSERKRNFSSFLALAGIIILLISSLYFFYSSAQKYMAAVYYKQGLESASLEQAAVLMEKSIKLYPDSDLFLRGLSQIRLAQANKLIQTATPANQQKSQDIQNQFQNFIVLAVNTAKRAAEINPIDPYNWYNLGNIYESLIPTKQADVLAQDNYRRAMELDPQNPQSPVDIARVFVSSADQESQKSSDNKIWQGKIDKAKAYLDKSINLKSDYAPTHFLMAQIYVREGNIDKAIEKVSQLIIVNPQDSGLAFQLGFLYYKNSQFSEAQSNFERAVSLNENYSNARYFLGLILDKNGEKQAAIEQFEKIEKLNPDNQEVKNILENLRADKPALEGIVPPAESPAERIETPVTENSK